MGKLQSILWGTLGAAFLCSAPALADRIDGNWCSADGRRIVIEGPSIVTPGGKAMQGQYSRHDFAYVAPDGEPDGGKAIALQLNGDTMMFYRRAGSTESDTFRRCPPAVS